MKNFWICAGYLLFLGIASHYVGEAIPAKRFDPEAFPYRCFPFEHGGKIYSVLKVERWKDIVPDMSKYIPAMFAKKVANHSDLASLRRLQIETCRAESVHFWLIVFGLPCLWIMPGAAGIVVTAVWIVLGNLPFMVIQRYNRPRITKLIMIKQRHEVHNGKPENTDPDL